MITEERQEELARQRAIIKKSRLVSYELLDKAKAHFWELFPDSDCISPQLYHNQIYCEVWKDGAAQIYFFDPE